MEPASIWFYTKNLSHAALDCKLSNEGSVARIPSRPAISFRITVWSGKNFVFADPSILNFDQKSVYFKKSVYFFTPLSA